MNELGCRCRRGCPIRAGLADADRVTASPAHDHEARAHDQASRRSRSRSAKSSISVVGTRVAQPDVDDLDLIGGDQLVGRRTPDPEQRGDQQKASEVPPVLGTPTLRGVARAGGSPDAEGPAVSREILRRAVELFKTAGEPMARSPELGVSETGLRNWVVQAEIDAGEREGLTKGERDELAELRRQNRRLTMENEILERAAAYFAQENVLRE